MDGSAGRVGSGSACCMIRIGSGVVQPLSARPSISKIVTNSQMCRVCSIDSFLAVGFVKRFQRRIQLPAVINDSFGIIGALPLAIRLSLILLRHSTENERNNNQDQYNTQPNSK